MRLAFALILLLLLTACYPEADHPHTNPGGVGHGGDSTPTAPGRQPTIPIK